MPQIDAYNPDLQKLLETPLSKKLHQRRKNFAFRWMRLIRTFNHLNTIMVVSNPRQYIFFMSLCIYPLEERVGEFERPSLQFSGDGASACASLTQILYVRDKTGPYFSQVINIYDRALYCFPTFLFGLYC